MASSSSSSSTSSTAPAWTYDVLLSFRGADTRHGFTSDLYNALRQSGIHAFMDRPGIESGDDIYGSLFQAIERSRIALVIFSENYASSGWCLNELLHIMECRTRLAQVVIPIFYGVDPSDVRHQTGTCGEAMERHEQWFRTIGNTDRVLRWRKALRAAASLAGFPSSECR
ncbi:TMV resistance protein N-like [Neltuma alba]|uniref:TMV resistance protein N-like n=1 Tax=Neltuma alba TaxID=207710 RepID=UPI0010A473BC|nr:TMV resistance protein N-like [Prosopis alba]